MKLPGIPGCFHRVNSQSAIVKARLSNMGRYTGDGIQPDQAYLFAPHLRIFERMNYNINGSKIHTTAWLRSGQLFGHDAGNDDTAYRDVMNYIEYELEQLLTKSESPQSPKIGRSVASKTFSHYSGSQHSSG